MKYSWFFKSAAVLAVLFFCLPVALATAQSECTDSDSGRDYFTKGDSTDFGDTMEDSCFDANTVTEFYCEQAPGQTRPSRGAEQKKCDYGCQDGACAPEPQNNKVFTVYAGLEVYYENFPFTITGEASDLETNLSDTMDMRWSMQAGPYGGKIKFSNPQCLARNLAAYCKTSISANKDGVYKIRLKVTNPKKISVYDDIALVWDTKSPVLKEVKKIPHIGNDPNPTIVFSSTPINAVSPVYNRFGDIIYGGKCQGHATSATQGNNSVELVTLADGTYGNCTIQVKDMAGNLSKVLKISKFTIDTQPPTLSVTNGLEENATEASYTIFGTKKAGTAVKLGGKEIVKHNSNKSWKYKVKLNDGENNFDLVAEDEAGNKSEKIVLSVELKKPTCTAWAYGAWGKCDDNLQTRKIVSASPRGCAGGEPAMSKVCKVEKGKPLCESYNYSTWNKCVNNRQSRTIESTLPDNCRGGEAPLVSRECGKDYCDFVNYTAWSSCNTATGKKTRQIESTSPEVCVVENPELEKSCNACESYNYSMWSACVNNNQTRTIESTFPTDCSGGIKSVLNRECGKNYCDYVYYTTWSACDKITGKRTRQVESTSPKVCVVENPELSKDCNACESYNYSMWSSCVNNTQTRTIESTFPADCSGGVAPVKSRECGKDACDFIYYTTWSACNQSTGRRTRQIESTVPAVCVPQDPVLGKDCNACESFNYSMWSSCVNNNQTRVVESTFPVDCHGGAVPLVSRECGKEFCDFVYYTTWSKCDKNTGQRTRQIESTMPAVCVPESPLLSKDCDICESYNYSAWSACDANGVQHRTLETDPTVSPTFPADCYGGAVPVYTRACPPCDSWIYNTWGQCLNGQQFRTIDHATYPPGCWGGSPALTKSCG